MLNTRAEKSPMWVRWTASHLKPIPDWWKRVDHFPGFGGVWGVGNGVGGEGVGGVVGSGVARQGGGVWWGAGGTAGMGDLGSGGRGVERWPVGLVDTCPNNGTTIHLKWNTCPVY